MPRIILDANVLVSAAITQAGVSGQIFAACQRGAVELIVSPLLLAELSDVLRRTKFSRYVTPPEAEDFIALVRATATEAADPQPSPQRLTADPDDDYLVALARATAVDALVSGDHHLLQLAPPPPVLTPRQFLDSLEQP